MAGLAGGWTGRYSDDVLKDDAGAKTRFAKHPETPLVVKFVIALVFRIRSARASPKAIGHSVLHRCETVMA